MHWTFAVVTHSDHSSIFLCFASICLQDRSMQQCYVWPAGMWEMEPGCPATRPALTFPTKIWSTKQTGIFWMKKWYRQAAISEVSLLPSFQHVMCPVCQKIFKFAGADLQHSPFENFIPSGLPLSCMLVQGCSLLKQCDLLQFVLCQARWLVDWCSSSSTPSITNIRVSYE